MDPLGPFSAQNSVLSLLKTGAANLSAAKKQSAQDALLAELEKSDPEKTAALKKQLQESRDMLQRLQSSRTSFVQQRKADAAEKIMRIKEKLAMLRLLAAVNPDAAARQAAQLARELKQAVSAYGSAGGAAPAVATPSAGTADTAQGADASTQSAGGGETPATPETPRTPIDEIRQQREQDNQALRDKMQERGNAAMADAAKSRADSEFAQAAKDIKEAIERILEAAKRKLEEKGDADNPDIAAGKNTLRGVDTAISGISTASTPVIADAVNILA